MTTLATNLPTLMDLATQEVNGIQQPVIEILAQTNEVLQDIPWEEGNLPTGHKTTLRTALPTISSRTLNAGVTPVKSATEQITDSCAILEAYTVCDKVLVEMAANPAMYRMGENRATIEAFGQKFTSLLFSGNATTTPSDFTGLGPRYNEFFVAASTTTGTNGTAKNVIDAGGAGSDNSSMWLVGWGPQAVCGIYPRGGFAGMRHEDKGEQIWQTSTTLGGSTSALRAYVSWFEWRCGLSVRDWRNVVRISNIDLSEAQTASGDQADTALVTHLLNMMVRAYYMIPNPGSVKLAFYCNRTVAFALHVLAMKRASAQITIEQVDGKPVTMFLGVPIKRVDQLGIAESLTTQAA